MQNITQEQAKQLLKTLPFEKWCDASLMFPPKTIHRRKLKSLHDLLYLFTDVASSLVFIDIPKITQWIDKDVGDKELALLIQAQVDTKESYIKQLQQFKELVINRIKFLELQMES